MSSNRPQQSSGGASSVPSTSSSGTGSTGNSSGGGGGGSSTVPGTGNHSGNLVPSRTVTAATEGGSPVPSLAAVPSSRGGFASLCRPSASSGSRKKSLHQTPLYNGLLNSYEDKSNDFVWWACFFFVFVLLFLHKHLSSNHVTPPLSLIHYVLCLLSTALFVSKWSRRHTWPSVGTVFGKSNNNNSKRKKSILTGYVVYRVHLGPVLHE